MIEYPTAAPSHFECSEHSARALADQEILAQTQNAHDGPASAQLRPEHADRHAQNHTGPSQLLPQLTSPFARVSGSNAAAGCGRVAAEEIPGQQAAGGRIGYGKEAESSAAKAHAAMRNVEAASTVASAANLAETLQPAAERAAQVEFVASHRNDGSGMPASNAGLDFREARSDPSVAQQKSVSETVWQHAVPPASPFASLQNWAHDPKG
jgi:hypothetical protein